MEIVRLRMKYHEMDVEQVVNPRGLTTSDLITYIVKKHHVFGRNVIEKIRHLMSEMDHSLPQFAEFEDKAEAFFTELLDHFDDEEVHVFPQVFEAVEQRGERSPSPKHKMMIMKVEKDHVRAETQMKFLIEMSNSIGLPAQVVSDAFRELEEDLEVHMELEQQELHRRVRMIYQLSP